MTGPVHHRVVPAERGARRDPARAVSRAAPAEAGGRCSPILRAMRAPRRILLVLHPAVHAVERLPARQGWLVRRFACWATLRGALADAPPATIALVDPYHDSGDRLAPELHELLRHFPSATVVAAVDEPAAGPADLRTLSIWGVADVLPLAEEHTANALHQRFARVRVREVCLQLEELSAGLSLPVRARQILRAAAEVTAVGGLSRDLARSMAVQRNTLTRWCARAGLPAPRRLMLWIRALHAAALLDDPGRTVESAARACGYSGADALRRGLRLVVHWTPSELRTRGALRTLAAEFGQELRGTDG
jgi:AraC-like DNA-binding protein